MDDFDCLMEKATSAESQEMQPFNHHYIVFFENRQPMFDMARRNYLFPKCHDQLCVDRTDHTIDQSVLLTDSVLDLTYDYFLKGHPLRFKRCQYVSGIVDRVQKLLDDGGVAYDKSMYFDLRHNGRVSQWNSINYLSRMKLIVDPARKQQFPSLREIIVRTWPQKFDVAIRSSCFSVIQELMIVDYVHSLSRMRPDYDRDVVNRLARAAQTDFDLHQPWTFDVTVEFIPSKRCRREVADVLYDIVLEFHASSRRRVPYEEAANAEDTDVEDDDML